MPRRRLPSRAQPSVSQTDTRAPCPQRSLPTWPRRRPPSALLTRAPKWRPSMLCFPMLRPCRPTSVGAASPRYPLIASSCSQKMTRGLPTEAGVALRVFHTQAKQSGTEFRRKSVSEHRLSTALRAGQLERIKMSDLATSVCQRERGADVIEYGMDVRKPRFHVVDDGRPVARDPRVFGAPRGHAEG